MTSKTIQRLMPRRSDYETDRRQKDTTNVEGRDIVTMPTRSRSRSPEMDTRNPTRKRRRDNSRSQSRSRSRERRRKHHSRSRSRSRDKGEKRGRARSISGNSDSSEGTSHRRKGHHKDKDGKRSKSKERRRKEKRRERKEKKEKKKKDKGSTLHWGKYGIISDVDIFSKNQEFYTWLVEERKINPETVSKEQQKKEFSRFVEDYNTATLTHEKYYNMEAYERRMSALRQGEYLPPANDSYDFEADMKAVTGAHKKKATEQETYMTKEQLMQLRKVQQERNEVGRMKLLGMDVKQNFGVRMDGTMFDARMSQIEEDSTFFERERDRLSREITSEFEELLLSSNVLNRKLEEVLGMTKEYSTIAALWHSFYQLMRNSGQDNEATEEQPGVPGTGSHLVSTKQGGGGSSKHD